jgi:NAD(P)-dependent dehydrogenase (short-subunit alcohol dehydrogenase family)
MYDDLLKNKVALVTGAAGAIGYGICEVFLENGCTVVATDLPGEKLNEFVNDLNKLAPGKAIGLPMDVTDIDSVAKALDDTYAKLGQLNILIHNAGIAYVSKIVDMDMERFKFLEKVNVDGTLIVLKEAGKRMIEKDKGGDIVIMSTKNVPSPSAGFGAYSATKAACHQLGRIASLEFAPHNIRVNMVAPDAVFSEGKYKSGLWDLVGEDRMKARGINEDQLHEYYRNRNLLKAAVTGRHVANAVLFFVSRQSPTTGATIPVDGGLPDATPR